MHQKSRIIDIHTHAFPDFLAEKAIIALEATSGDEKAHLNGTISDLLKSMDRAGIEISVICSIATAPKQVPSITQWSKEIASERIVPFPSIHPDYTDFRDEIARIKDLGIKGTKMHPQFLLLFQKEGWGFCSMSPRSGGSAPRHGGARQFGVSLP